MAENLATSNADSIDRLDAVMEQLLDLLRRGDWELLPDLESTLLPALEAVRQGGPTGSRAWQPAKIQALQKKLEEAVRECETRKSQIAPLLSSLDRIQRKTGAT